MKKKIRVWDGKRYYYLHATSNEHNHYLQIGDGEFWLYSSFDGKLITCTSNGGVLEQFSGFFLNTQIFENDLIKVNNFIFRVVFEKGAFYLYHSKHSLLGRWGLLGRLFDSDIFKVAEVVGNIHENKELC